MATLPEASGTEVEPGIYCVPLVYAEIKPLYVYVIAGRFALWVDVGINTTPARHVIPYLEEHAPDVWRRPQWAFITHADMDHYGGLRALQARRPETPVLGPAADQRWIEQPDAILRERFLLHEPDGISPAPERQRLLLERGGGGGTVDVALVGGETIQVGEGSSWRVLHTPGHTRGHLVLWNAARRWAMIGDAALDWGVPDVNGALLAPPPYFDLPSYRRTLGELQALQAERMFTSHYGILDAAQTERLLANSLAAIETIAAALDQVLGRHRDGVTLRQLCHGVGASSGRWPEAVWPGLADPLSAHLAEEISNGRVERIATDGPPQYRLRSA